MCGRTEEKDGRRQRKNEVVIKNEVAPMTWHLHLLRHIVTPNWLFIWYMVLCVYSSD